MNNVQKDSLVSRLRAAWRALSDKPTKTLGLGVDIKRCDECRGGGPFGERDGCHFCDAAGVHHVHPVGLVDGLGVKVPKYCFNCGKRLFIPPNDMEE